MPDMSDIVLRSDGVEVIADTGRIANIPEGFDLADVVLTDLGEIIPDKPLLNNIAQSVDVDMLKGFTNDDSGSDLNQTISKDVANTNSTSNQTKIDLGGISVKVEGGSSDPQTSGKIIGEKIRQELEPLFKQASIDLNSAVTI